ncbi:hypothetical protein NEOLEDRAFT_1134442 [Neolentinus lepideus HHB14362 ss-1]|uniref:Peptidase C14 caspase domain-containing protein n=1 Tax=Neolentinus lepideus HHB14362 ss-1 TaxID=1314782 RepID=A0A165S893_9AGAM|nr:hypothetical protein NEOLEDRAFT_1134442 [Neolentinus lepideus HHB14362 ss-1]
MPGLVQRSQSGSPGPSTGKRRALLIGINYAATKDYVLEGPNADARTFKQLLKERYGYEEEDIKLMTDDDRCPKYLRPSRANIRREAANLVRGAQSGDRFVFFYAGHADQEAAVDDTDEEDGQDEEILGEDDLSDDQSSTSSEQRIRDNDLRQILVDPLPAGSSLIAIFDCCHSGTMLDLEHYHCNLPWNPTWKTSPIAPYDLAAHHYRSMRHIHTPPHSRRPSENKSKTATTATFPTSETTVASSRPRRMTWASLTNPPGEASEEATTTVICTGECPKGDDDVAHIISISACLDSQLAWEGPDGGSITQVLVRFLRQKTDCTLYDVVLELSRKLQHAGWLVEQQRAEQPEDFVDAPGPAYQVPQIGSRSALDLHSQFTL